jgi:hypothetical protein
MLSFKVVEEYDCKQQRRRTVWSVWFREQMGQGEAMETDSSHGDWEAILPNTFGWSAFRRVCAQTPTVDVTRAGTKAGDRQAEASEAMRHALPFVTEARDRKCRLEVTGGGEVFSVHVEGLEPGESADTVLSNDGAHQKVETARPDGTFGFALFAAVRGQTSGTVRYTVKSAHCQLGVTFAWHLTDAPAKKD